MARYKSANQILNAVALELGIEEDPNPYATTNSIFTQLKGLLNSAGQEMVELYDWQVLKKEHSFVTDAATDDGVYDLPDDFSSMIPQTGWDRTNEAPLIGPASSQVWAYLKGRDLVSQTIYATFRLMENKLKIFPDDPVPDALTIAFEYKSRNWVQENSSPVQYHDHVVNGADWILFEPILVVKFLKAKYLEAKGFSSEAARQEFVNIFGNRTGVDESSPILNAGRGASRRHPYLDPMRNLGDTNYGLS